MPPGAVARTIQEFGRRRASEPDLTNTGRRSADSGRQGFLSGLLHAAQSGRDISPAVDTTELAEVMNHVMIQAILEAVTNRGTDEPLDQVLARRARLILYGATATYLARAAGDDAATI
jgi:hypothetical protein